MSKELLNKTGSILSVRLSLSLVKQFLSFAFGIILARLLTPQEFGIIALVNMVVSYVDGFTNFGLNNAIVQAPEIKKEQIDTVFSLDLFLSIFFCAVTYMMSGIIGEWFHSENVSSVMKWMSLYYLVTAFYYMPHTILRRNVEFKLISIIEVLQTLFTYSISVFLAYLGYSYWSIAYPAIIVPALFALYLSYATGWYPKLSLSKDMSSIYTFGVWGFFRSQIGLLVSKVDQFIIGKYLGVENLGIYSKSFNFTNQIMTGLAMPISGVCFSTFSRISEDRQAVNKLLMRAMTILSLLCFPVFLGIAALHSEIIIVLFGENWTNAIVPMQILSLACVAKSLTGLTESANIALGMYRLQTILNLLLLLFFAVSCFIYINHGTVFICFLFLLYSILSCLGNILLLIKNKICTFKDFIIAVWCPLLGACLMYFLVEYLSSVYFIAGDSLTELLILVSSGALFYLLWTIFFLKIKIINIRFAI